MTIEEITRIQISFGKNKKRKWDLTKMDDLRKAIEECLQTGKEVLHRGKGEVIIYHVRPEYPLIPEAMEKPENKSLIKVSVSVFTQAFNLGVRG